MKTLPRSTGMTLIGKEIPWVELCKPFGILVEYRGGALLRILLSTLQRQWLSHAALFGISRLPMPRMQELRSLFFQPQQLHVDALLVPAESAADFFRGFTAALFLPACAQSNGHPAQKDIAQRDGKFVGHSFHGFRHQM